jgi:hypothetical protein
MMWSSIGRINGQDITRPEDAIWICTQHTDPKRVVRRKMVVHAKSSHLAVLSRFWGPTVR